MFSNVTLLYFLLLVPLSGFIAWLGDRIGHKTGKRRHTLFGLRPRHTAMVFTVGTGMCISFVSFALIYCLSSDFRHVVNEGQRLFEVNRQLRSSNADLSQSTKLLRRQKEQASAAEQKAKSAKESAVAERDNAIAQRDSAVRQQNDATARLHAAQAAMVVADSSLSKARVELAGARTALIQTQSSLRGKSAELITAKQRVQVAETQVAVATEQATEAHQRATEAAQIAETVLAEQKHQQEQALANLHLQLDNATAQYNAQKLATLQQQSTLADLNRQVDAEKQELDAEKKALAEVRLNTEALREHQITYQVGEEVDRIAIKPGYNIWRIEAILDSFLTTAAKKAEVKGARKDKGGYRAVAILPQIAEPAQSGGPPRVVTEDDTIRAAAARIRTANTDVVVIADAVANAVAGEPVPVELKIANNPIVFAADAQIGDAHINGRGTPEEIADALYAFLRQDVRHTLLKAGVIPASPGGSESDSTASLVSLSSDDWLRIMDRIRLAGDNARVVVTAAHDVRAGDLPLPLNFDVKGVPGGIFRQQNPF